MRSSLGLALACAVLSLSATSRTSSTRDLALRGGGLAARFEASRIGLGELSLRLSGYGRAGRVHAIEPVQPREDGAFVRYHHGDVEEWYRADAHGVEQGFTLDAPASGAGEVVLDLAVDGASPQVVTGDVFLRARERVVSVSDLSVVDADGRTLPSTMVATADGLRVRFDDADARYPVVVDPYYALTTKWIPSGNGTLDAGCNYGVVRSVGLRAYVGVECPSSANGAVYVLRWNGSALIEEARIGQPNVTSGSRFGYTLDPDETALRVAIGAPGENAVYVFVNAGSSWTQETKLPITPSGGDRVAYAADGTNNGDLFVHSSSGIQAFRRTGSLYVAAGANIYTGTAGVSRMFAARNRQLVVGTGYVVGGADRPVDRFTWNGSAWTFAGGIGLTSSYCADLVASGNTFLFGSRIFVYDGTNITRQTEVNIAGGGDKAWSLNGDLAAGIMGPGSTTLITYQRTGTTWAMVDVMSPTGGANTGVAVLDATHLVTTVPTEIRLQTLGVKKTSGSACTAAYECETNFCTEGVCCNLACTGGPCVSCIASKKGSGVDGVCGNVNAGLVGKGGCTNAGTACGPDGLCAGNGSCRGNAPAGQSCGATTCAASTLTGPSCNGAGACTTTPTTCGTYVCKDAASCFTSCTVDGNCAAPNFCIGGTCRGKLADGEPAIDAAHCVSGTLADGVCCNTACTGACEACTTTKKGAGPDGTCGPIAATTDPDDECKPRCMGAAVVAKGSCDGAGACTSGATSGCAPYGCESGACKSQCFDDSDCSGASCAMGACVTKTDAGPADTATPDTGRPDVGSIDYDGGAPLVSGTFTRCASASECSSGFCVEGVCCDSACTGTCRSCAQPFAPGRCSLIPTGLDPRRECGAGQSCHETCDGAGACMAVRPGDQCAPARCVGPSTGVGPAVCPAVDSACPTDSAPFDCGPYACVSAFGACATRCVSSVDCAPAFTCDTATALCVAAPTEDDGGCTMSDAPSGARSDLAWLAAGVSLAVSVVVARRRRGSRV